MVIKNKTVVELRSIAKNKGLKGYSTLRKDDLVRCIETGVCSSSKSSPSKTSSPKSSPKKGVAKKGGCTDLKKSEIKVRTIKGKKVYYVKCEGAKRSQRTTKNVYDKIHQLKHSPSSSPEKVEPIVLLDDSQPKMKIVVSNKGPSDLYKKVMARK